MKGWSCGIPLAGSQRGSRVGVQLVGASGFEPPTPSRTLVTDLKRSRDLAMKHPVAFLLALYFFGLAWAASEQFLLLRMVVPDPLGETFWRLGAAASDFGGRHDSREFWPLVNYVVFFGVFLSSRAVECVAAGVVVAWVWRNCRQHRSTPEPSQRR